jgi:hypothetical protein
VSRRWRLREGARTASSRQSASGKGRTPWALDDRFTVRFHIDDDEGPCAPSRAHGAHRASAVHLQRSALGYAGSGQGMGHQRSRKEDKRMSLLWVVAVVFFVLWLLGFAAFHVTNGLIHILLLLAVIAVVFRLVTGRRTA